MKIDFTNEINNYWNLLDNNDLKNINNYFNQEEVLNILNEIEKKRKKSIFLIILNFIIFLILNTLFPEYIIFFVIIFCILFVLIIIYASKKSIKKDIFPWFVKTIDKNISYSLNEEYFDWDIEYLKNECVEKIIKMS